MREINVADKLREEIQSDDTNRRYLKACLKETLRMNTVISGNIRRTTREHSVGGYLIPIGVSNTYVLLTTKPSTLVVILLEFSSRNWTCFSSL